MQLMEFVFGWESGDHAVLSPRNSLLDAVENRATQVACEQEMRRENGLPGLPETP
jgi:hypothetical protein